LFSDFACASEVEFLDFVLLYRFTPLVPVENKGNIVCYENTVLFIICSFLMINVSVAFAAGAPYRRPMYTNRKSQVYVVYM
jgi:cation-transporting ATPase 13A3/4/5